MMSTVIQKDEAYKLVDGLPEQATWDDLMREVYVRMTIERGIADSEACRTKCVHEIRKKYGLEK